MRSVDRRSEGSRPTRPRVFGATRRRANTRPGATGLAPEPGPWHGPFDERLDPEEQVDSQVTTRTPGSPRSSRRRRIVLGVVVAVVLLAAYPAWNVLSVWNDWRSVDRETFDPAAFAQLPEVEASISSDEVLPDGATLAAPTAAQPTGPTNYQTFMIVGVDRSELRADVIILAMLPDDDSPPVMVSLPRDLYLPNRCTQSLTRINANFNGCGDINGPTALSGAIKDFTGYQVDHFAIFTFDGFAAIIDQLGGFEICVDHPTRERRKFELSAGCTLADGETTLGWVRSRKTQELVDGRWQSVTNVSDFSRNQRQQDLILSIFEQAAQFSSPSEMTAIVGSLADAFTLDDQLGTSAAVDLAWNNRSLDPNTIVRPKIPVVDHVTSGGAQVLIPTKSFHEVVDEALSSG